MQMDDYSLGHYFLTIFFPIIAQPYEGDGDACQQSAIDTHINAITICTQVECCQYITMTKSAQPKNGAETKIYRIVA